jgi:pyruvate carboxylase
MGIATIRGQFTSDRVTADESYEVGEAGHPIRAYLDVDLMVGLAQPIGADAV